GIAGDAAVARKLASFVEVRTGVRVDSVRSLKAKLVVNCAGLHSDRGARSRLRVIPFRGEYYHLKRPELVRGLIYPVPDLTFPFLDVHFTKKVGGSVEVGPNAVLALAREGYRWGDVNVRDLLDTVMYPGFWRLARLHWRVGLKETGRSLVKPEFLRSAQLYDRELGDEDLVPGG